jgi:hypothetical protein
MSLAARLVARCLALVRGGPANCERERAKVRVALRASGQRVEDAGSEFTGTDDEDAFSAGYGL